MLMLMLMFKLKLELFSRAAVDEARPADADQIGTMRRIKLGGSDPFR